MRPMAAEVAALRMAFQDASEGAADFLGGIGGMAFQRLYGNHERVFRVRQRYGKIEYRCAVYRFCCIGNGSSIEKLCGTVLRYTFLELAVNGSGSSTDFGENGIR